MLLAKLFDALIQTGRLTLIDADGRAYQFGPGPEPSATIRLHDRALHRKILLNPRLAIGEAYMAGTLTIEEGDLYGFLALVMGNVEAAPPSAFAPLWRGLDQGFRRLQQFNPRSRARANVAHHYDLSGRLYDLFLDSDRQYSCAYFESPDQDLEGAQYAKKRHIAAKLRLEPGMRVLDIGCGWGGLALYLARECGVEVTGLTLSEEQHGLATRRAAAAGLESRVRFLLQDYREERGRYDRIVSVGMFEHVGVGHYREFFEKVSDLLAPDGVALLHSIGRREGPGNTNPWIRKYIFPGGHMPSMSEVFAAIERTRLWATDVEILRLHYAETLLHWRRRFAARRAEAAALYDERFCRMWEFYLTASEASFRVQCMMVFQLQITKRVDTLPIRRDYMVDWERAHDRMPVSEPAAEPVG